MFAWRKRIGHISPGTVSSSAYDFYLIAPEGVGMVAVSNPIGDWKQDEYERALKNVVSSAKYLAGRHVDFINHAGAPPVASQGPDFVRRIKREIEEATELPASTALYSASEALRSLNAQNIVVITPFPQKSHEQVVSVIGALGFNVVSESRMNANFDDLYLIGEQQVYDFVTKSIARAPKAEAAYVPCPQWHVFELARYIESDKGLPLVTSDSGDFWYAFKTLGLRDVKPGYGILLESLRSSASGTAA
jgi:maleate cis-trans isomerase